MIEKALKAIGLNEGEITVYSELLTIGSSAASTIAARTKINKSTVRYICQGLVKKGLIFSIKKDTTFIYSPESPNRLYTLLKEDKRKLKEKEDNIEKTISYFENIKNKRTSLPEVTFYQGKEGLEKLYAKILEINKPIDSIEDNGEMVSAIPECVDFFISERKRKKIYNRVICPSKNTINVESIEDLRTVKTIDEKFFPFSGDIKICGDKVNIMSFIENNSVAISITDENIANNFRLIFNYMWSQIGDNK
ncbi:MAG: helix-turn-helix domain-containing protein [Candidatus Gracilibacteria bacterium]|nr:helix-turn-helix domain-containing protein [Candidatus Gracilibacteria bacterium]